MRKDLSPFFMSNEDLVPFEVEEFRQAFDIVMRAASDPGSTAPPEASIVGEDFEHKINVGVPLASAVEAIKWLYPTDPHKYMSMNLRFFAFLKLMRDPDFERWIVKKGKGCEIHDALIAAAASAVVIDGGDFAKLPLLEATERIARENYGS